MKKKGGPLLLLNDGENEKKKGKKRNYPCMCVHIRVQTCGAMGGLTRR